MPQGSMVGSRIRERRMLAGIRQSDLAKRAGISASYLNLIEHNRRRIGGKTLIQLATALEVEPLWLSEGAEATLVAGLQEAATAQPQSAVELDRTEEFASRFPGWAELLTVTARRVEELEQTVQALTDRLAHDPHLATSLHEVISMVTAIRSTASILAETKELEPEWRARFNRNINEDSRRLAEGAEALVRYLEDAPDQNSDIRSPQDELHAFLLDNGYCFPSLEDGTETREQLIDESEALASEAGRQLALRVLSQYEADAIVLPMQKLADAIEKEGLRPEVLIDALNISAPVLFRRLAFLPADRFGPIGLVVCDASGAIVFRKSIAGFDLPRSAGACASWPLFEVLGQPALTRRVTLEQDVAGGAQFHSYSVTEITEPAGFDRPARHLAYMLLLPSRLGEVTNTARAVGTTCRVCPHQSCSARREPSILAKGF